MSYNRPRLPGFRIAMSVENAEDSNLQFTNHKEHAVGKAAQQGPPNFAVNLGISIRVFPDSLQAFVQRAAEL
jgi:hypothetical protein